MRSSPPSRSCLSRRSKNWPKSCPIRTDRPMLFFVYTGANFSSRLPLLQPKWKPHPNLLTPYSTISVTGTPGDMPARNVYTPSESERKCPGTLENKQKTARPALRDQEAAGSNPVTPMRKPAKSLRFGGLLIFAFSGLTTCRTIDRSTFGETIFLFCSVPEFRGAGGRRRRGFSLSSAGENLPVLSNPCPCYKIRGNSLFASFVFQHGRRSHFRYT